MNKGERFKLANIIIDMQHGSGATYETYNLAETLMTEFPSVVPVVSSLEDAAYCKKITGIIRNYLSKSLNPACVTHGRYSHAYRLYQNTFEIIEHIVEDYAMDSCTSPEDLFGHLDANLCNSIKSDRILEILSSSLWGETVQEYTSDSLEIRYLKGELEEYSFIEEMS